MSEQEGVDRIDAEATAGMDLDEVDMDQDLAFGEDGEDDNLDRSYVPNDRPVAATAHGTTAEEQHEGGSLEARLEAEEPEVFEERPGDAVLPTDQPLTDATGEDVSSEDLAMTEDDDSEVGDLRAGRLVEPDEGVREDTEKDLVAEDVGIDAGAASAEEAAMHVTEDPRT
ncbi:DUF5709 domain-containing protein [Aquipuribacter nitratireducens]|uniref:DUF5709 domain-containing protein n=1 Tax=Aquipuribacter nitratireducens TaxID=650104 RepID=A0ABW0GMG0_9MICO